MYVWYLPTYLINLHIFCTIPLYVCYVLIMFIFNWLHHTTHLIGTFLNLNTIYGYKAVIHFPWLFPPKKWYSLWTYKIHVCSVVKRRTALPPFRTIVLHQQLPREYSTVLCDWPSFSEHQRRPVKRSPRRNDDNRKNVWWVYPPQGCICIWVLERQKIKFS